MLRGGAIAWLLAATVTLDAPASVASAAAARAISAAPASATGDRGEPLVLEDAKAVAAPVDRQRLAEILERPEFSRARERQSDAWERLWQRIRLWFFELIETSGVQSFSNITRFLVLALAIALALAGALRLLAFRRRSRGRVPGSVARPEQLALELEDPAIHLARADGARDPREKIREGLLALLSSLERARLARPDRVKTNRELAAELPRRGAPPDLSECVTGLLHWYDRTFYSLDPVPADAARRFVEEVKAVDATVSRRSVA